MPDPIDLGEYRGNVKGSRFPSNAGGGISSGDGGGGGEDMLAELKKSVADLEKVVDVLKATVATKEDLHKELNAATSKYVGWMFLLLGFYTTVVVALKYLHP